MLKKIFISIITVLCVSSVCPAEKIYLKSGKTIEAKIIEKTDKYLKADYYGIGLTFYYDEITKIDKDEEISTAVPKSGKKCFLWKVKSLNANAYILGSIHIAKKSLYPLSKKIEEAFDKSDSLVVEVDIYGPNQEAMQESMMRSGFYPGNSTLKKHISRDTYEAASKKLTELSLAIEQLDNYKPWFLALTLANLELMKLGYDPNYGIDKHFLDAARGRKNILELETYDFQIKLLDQFPDHHQDLFLFYTLIDLGMLEKEVDKLMNSWLLGDTAAVETILLESLRHYPQLLPIFEKIFFERNRNMASKIEKYLKIKGNYFIIVGAGHLVGREGVISLLAEKGYAVEQL